MKPLLLIALILAATLGSGCMTRAMENSAAADAVAQGYRPAYGGTRAYVATVDLGEGNVAEFRHSAKELALRANPIGYRLAQTFDFAIIPGAILAAGAYAVQELDGGGVFGDQITIDAGRDVRIVSDGDTD